VFIGFVAGGSLIVFLVAVGSTEADLLSAYVSQAALRFICFTASKEACIFFLCTALFLEM